jgi:hypothetical protein
MGLFAKLVGFSHQGNLKRARGGSRRRKAKLFLSSCGFALDNPTKQFTVQ